MDDATAFRRLLSVLPEPLLVVDRAGAVEVANPGARSLLGSDPQGANLLDYIEDEGEFLAYLGRCSGSGSPLLGSMVVKTPAGCRKVQAQGAVFARGSAAAATILLRLRADAGAEFSVLGQKVRELNREIRQHRRAQAALEEAVRHREVLLQELHHRVKNHTQMLLGMLSLSAREADSEEVRIFIGEFRSRLLAIASSQQLMYQAGEFASVPARDFLESLCQALAQTWPPGAVLTTDSDQVELRNDVTTPVALIVNELTANALKHGLGFGPGRVAVTLRRAGQEIVLTVWDCGPAWAETAAPKRSSGLTLVRGLCRQIGGAFDISRGEGTFCTVKFPYAAAESAG
ncbi:MAG: histidine kinase dimerization/phosphoacceptor domain -containing protein [Tistlia sp.]|uniref:sensor histidine kinase n=1 Tax=Tistlia sp. TaxID=3057121 RepID=UPI0034A40FAA